MTLNEFIQSEFYPIRVNYPELVTETEHSGILTRLGFTILDADRELGLFKVKFPAGWNRTTVKKSTNWMYLYDEKGRVRSATFFVDNNGRIVAFVNYRTCYRPIVKHVGEFSKTHKDYLLTPLIGVVQKGSETIYRTQPLGIRSQTGTPTFARQEKALRQKLFDECEQWLKKQKPQFENIMAYWEEK